ncbi:MAG: ImmA/IrrE family metallo-endopeptidase [Chloroflexi bacterium]|nr:ImmA/IrrE family metallo-endopeptidase [Chloroflexota bacterium]
MNEFRARDGSTRLWLDDAEIEAIAGDELRRAGLAPTPDHPVVDLESFVEQHLRAVLDQYATLPNDVLGQTEFRRGEQPRVLINRDLTGSALDVEDPRLSAVGRWRATLAHEAAHILLHRHLFEFGDAQLPLVAPRPTAQPVPLVRCLKREVTFRSVSSDWREVQANKGMAALLMPRGLFTTVARRAAAREGIDLPVAPGQRGEERLVGAIAPELQVSGTAARIRLATCSLASDTAALRMTEA